MLQSGTVEKLRADMAAALLSGNMEAYLFHGVQVTLFDFLSSVNLKGMNGDQVVVAIASGVGISLYNHMTPLAEALTLPDEDVNEILISLLGRSVTVLAGTIQSVILATAKPEGTIVS